MKRTLHPAIAALIERANNPAKQRKRPTDHEHQLQSACFKWFNFMYPQYRGLLFAIANGGQRNPIVASKLKAEGVVAGVADMQLAIRHKQYGALFIEMKTTDKHSRQSQLQKDWEAKVTANGHYKYVICRTLDEFSAAIKDYLKDCNL